MMVLRKSLWTAALFFALAVFGNCLGENEMAEKVFEVEVPNGFIAPIKLKDGRLFSVDRSHTLHSTDGGRTWEVSGHLLDSKGQAYSSSSYRRPFNLCRLRSGAIGLTYWEYDPSMSRSTETHGIPMSRYKKSVFRKSLDDGQTWSEPVRIAPPNTSGLATFLIQMESGRLIVPSEYSFVQNYNKHKDFRFTLCIVFYSDDEGETWAESVDSIFVREQEGALLHMAEAPCVAETADGRLLMFARTEMQRLLQSYSQDDGVHWEVAELSSLLSSRSEMLLTRIPSTGDLLCVWNQVDAKEIRTGFYRSRLSSAISKDSGKTWVHFRTIVQSEGMKKVSRILSSKPVGHLRSSGAVPHDPTLIPPEGFRSVRHPRVSVIDDKVYISFDDRLYRRADNKRGWENVHYKQTLRVMPLSWFYSEE